MELLPHQNKAIDWMQSRYYGLLAYDTGTGKTYPALYIAFSTVQHYGIPSLYVSQASLVSQAFEESEVLARVRACAQAAVLIRGTPKERLALYKDAFKRPTVLILSYETVANDIDVLSRYQYAAIIVDECTRLSNIKNKQRKALVKLKSTHRYALTGTPIQNSPTDLFGIMDWLKPGILGNWFSFMQKYTVRHPVLNFVMGTRNEAELAVKVAPHVLECKRSEVIDLPELSRSMVPVYFSPQESKLYDQLRDGYIKELEPELTKVKKTFTLQQILPRVGKLLEICDSLELVGESVKSSKLEACLGYMKDKIKRDDQVIVFTRYSRMAKILYAALSPARTCALMLGETSEEDRQNIKKQFKDQKIQVLICSKTGEFGHNLQSANYIIHYDAPFSYSSLVQREARAHRYGQTREVTTVTFYVKGTLEEKVLKNLDKKKSSWNKIQDIL